LLLCVRSIYKIRARRENKLSNGFYSIVLFELYNHTSHNLYFE
jgi:hypothetical protein